MPTTDDDLTDLIARQLDWLGVDAAGCNPDAIAGHLRNFAALYGRVADADAPLPVDPPGIYRP